MRYNLSAIMKRAWEIKREDSSYVFAICLKLAWAEAKVSERIEELQEKGFSRWTKGNFDRLYINADKLGLEADHYKSGSIRSAYFQGEKISNSQAGRMFAAKTYVDVKTGRIHGTNGVLVKIAANLADVYAA